MNTYFVSIQSIYELCGTAINHFQSYLQQLENSTKDGSRQQHHVVALLLEGGLMRMTFAQQKLEESRPSFDKISEDSLAPELDTDFADYRLKSNQEIARLRPLIKESRKCVLGICRDTDITRHLKSSIRKIEENLVNFEKLNNELKQAIKDSELNAKNMETKCKFEADDIAKLQTQTQVALSTMNKVIAKGVFDSKINNLIQITFENLIGQYQKYRTLHEQ